MGLFTPRHIKDARLLAEGASKTLHHHADILPSETKASLARLIAALREALGKGEKHALATAGRELEEGFASAIPSKPHAVLAENIESIVVAITLALGFQAYFLKPFKIPTGSMQPTLYGMTGRPLETTLPPPLAKALEFVRQGRSYIDLKATAREEVLALTEKTTLNFFTFTDIITSAGKHTVFSPRDVLARDFGVRPGRVYEPGETIVRGYVQAGDQVFVDRMTYRFRNPALSDVFVFLTTGIRRIEMNLDPALGSQFYIKRLAGMPGQTLRIDAPLLFQNGEKASLPPFLRVMSCENGYRGYSNPGAAQYLTSPQETFTVPSRGYFALGDNSYNSSDSRYWGIVPERNVIGRGFFVYWPFSDRWGFIR